MSSMNVNAVAKQRVTGLVSGMDVDGLVTQMLSGQQNKLNKAEQQKELLSWKKDSYRSAITKLTDFQSKYLDLVSSNSIIRPSNYKISTATLSNEAMSKYFTVASSEVSSGSFTVDKVILAKAHRIESNITHASDITFNIDPDNITAEALVGKSLNFKANGASRAITFNANDVRRISASGTDEAIMNELAAVMNEKLGAGAGTFALDADTGGLKFTAPNPNSTVEITGGAFGLPTAGVRNYIDPATKTLSSLGITSNGSFSINGVKIEFKANDTIASVMEKINKSDAKVEMTYESWSKNFALVSKESGAYNSIRIDDSSNGYFENIFGVSSGTTGFGNDVQLAQDAQIFVNGGAMPILSAGNTVTIGGITLNLLRDTPAAGGDFASTTITASADTSKLVEHIKGFVDEYNKLLEELNTMVSERRPRSGGTANGAYYLPLTSEQKEAMSEDDVKNWETEGKKGLLYGDKSLMGIIDSLKSAMSTPVVIDGQKVSFASIGIQTANYFADSSGKLAIDEDKLKAAIEKDPAILEKLFMQQSPYAKAPRYNGTNRDEINSFYTSKYSKPDASGTYKADAHGNIIKSSGDYQKALFNSQGLGRRFEDIFTSAIFVSTNENLRGTLIRTAGTGGANAFVDRVSLISQQTSRIDDTVARILTRMEADEEKYYNKFAKLETALAKLNNQASMLGTEQ